MKKHFSHVMILFAVCLLPFTTTAKVKVKKRLKVDPALVYVLAEFKADAFTSLRIYRPLLKTYDNQRKLETVDLAVLNSVDLPSVIIARHAETQDFIGYYQTSFNNVKRLRKSVGLEE